MRATLRIIAACSAAALASAVLVVGFAGSVQAAATVRVSVVGIDRAGTRVQVSAYAYSGSEPPVFLSGKPHAIRTGEYWIGASVTTPGASGGAASETLVVRHVRISHSETLRLDARPGKLVRLSLGLAGAQNFGQGVQACVPGTQAQFGAAPDGSGSPVYVVPLKNRQVVFGYSGTWQAGGAAYYIARQVRGGIPSHPVYRAAVAGLARDTLVLRDGTTTTSYQGWLLQRQFSSGCDIYEDALPVAATPSASVAYFSPGSWQVQVYGAGSFWEGTQALRAGHRYTDTFGAAVWGPAVYYPGLDFGQLSYAPDEPFADPQHPDGSECCDRSSVTLSLRGRTLKHQTMTEYKAARAFSYRLHSAGWYTMRTTATRWVPGSRLPARLLSPRETVSWRFYVGSDYATVDTTLMPVSSTRYLPRGLNEENQAQPGPATRIGVHVTPARTPGWATHTYRLRTVRVQASFNGGKTWRTVRLVRHGSYWLAMVPAAGAGYVALRSTVTDVRGDRTVQTIYRAYQIS